MAAVRDILPRAERLGAGVVYVSAPSKWLLKLAGDAQNGPIVVNCKGIAPGDTPCIVTLAELERLQGGGE